MRLVGVADRTPLLRSARIDEALGLRVLIKAECLQQTGSFKIRGAYNKMSQLDAAERRRGVVAFSSGNHAQGVARSAKLLGIGATIIMPIEAPKIKLDNTRSDGAKVVTYARRDANRVAIAEEIMDRTGAVLIPPYDDPDIMAGQGTIGLELAAQAGEIGCPMDAVFGPCSGGGMIGGTAIALSKLSPGTKIYSVEPEGFDDTKRSLKAGERLENAPGAYSICDALLLEIPGKITFAVNRELLAGGLTASEESVRHAVRLAFTELKIALEPSGAIGLAALLERRQEFAGKTVAIIATGGNTDAAQFAEIIGGAD
ncbi:MAG: threonine/serine dehydratase [Rhodospirillales bacterium]|nr:threonine/serine dehydratase [Rhodospirillales bacterium]